ncbi:MAG: molecular chaperone DnaJ, partial [Flavobacteriaceae bacterium]|nr:molecular chaperone DnaJ [Flavobacteriaceae bacterium]
MDFYEILEVTQNATFSEIKNSFKRLALRYHPDKNNGYECVNFYEIK